MAKASNNGLAQIVSTKDFNERVKLLLADKADPQPAPARKAHPRTFRKPGTDKPV